VTTSVKFAGRDAGRRPACAGQVKPFSDYPHGFEKVLPGVLAPAR
jgi:hypothetical protein